MPCRMFGFAASGTTDKKSSLNSIIHLALNTSNTSVISDLVHMMYVSFLFHFFVLIQKVEQKNQDAAKACAKQVLPLNK